MTAEAPGGGAYEAYLKSHGLRPVLVSGITLDEYTPMMLFWGMAA